MKCIDCYNCESCVLGDYTCSHYAERINDPYSDITETCDAFIPKEDSNGSASMEVRSEVKWFAEEMEKVLQQNDWKGGWKGCSIGWLIVKLAEEVGELATMFINADLGLGEQEVIKEVIKEAADVANVAMMIADVARRESNHLKTHVPSSARTVVSVGETGEEMKEGKRVIKRNWESLPAVMTLHETACFLGVGYRTVLQLAHRPGFPALKLGKKFLINRDLLRAWLEREAGK